MSDDGVVLPCDASIPKIQFFGAFLPSPTIRWQKDYRNIADRAKQMDKPAALMKSPEAKNEQVDWVECPICVVS